jgi:hypothetical protein
MAVFLNEAMAAKIAAIACVACQLLIYFLSYCMLFLTQPNLRFCD